MTELARLKFYATQPHSCSYLPEEQATTLFLDPSQPMDVHVYADLSEMGFRRSGDHLYRPHCQNCNACVPARIPVAQFSPNRQQKRIFKRNADLQVRPIKPHFSEEYFDLYQRYIEQRHADGDMYPPSRDQFSTFLVRDLPFSRFYEFRLDGRLLAVAVTDLLPNGLSAVYTFTNLARSAAASVVSRSCGKSPKASGWGWKRCISVIGSRTAKDELQDPISPHRIAD